MSIDHKVSKIKNIVEISSMITNSINFFNIKDIIIGKMLDSIGPSKSCVNLFYDDDYTNAYLVCSNTLDNIENNFKDITPRGVRIKFDEYSKYIHDAIKNQEVIYIKNIFEDERAVQEREFAKQEGYMARIVYPLIVNHKVIGFMTCFLKENELLDDEDMDYISSVASLISLSIDVTRRNDMSVAIINKLRQALTSINEATEKLYQNKDLNEFLNHLSKQACDITKSREVIITIENSKTIKKILSMHREHSDNQSHIFPIMSEIKSENKTGNYQNNREKTENTNVDTYVYYQLKNEKEVFGYIVCANANSYSDDDLSILNILANQVYVAIRLLEYSIVEINHKVLANELEILNKQQKLLMDTKKINHESSKNLDFYHKPSKVVGGDFYYSVKTKDKIIFILSDVMGHGIVANYVVALMKGAFKVLSKVCDTSGEILTKLNEILFDEFDKMEIFATSIVCIMDINKETLEISNAGHYVPSIINKSNEIEKNIKYQKGMPIGVLQSSKYNTDIIDLKNVKNIWMYTDGILEIKDKNRNEYGIDKLEKFMKKNSHKNYELLVNELEDELGQFAQKSNYEDDILLVMLANNTK